MLERLNPGLRLFCFCLAALFVLQCASLWLRKSPLAGLPARASLNLPVQSSGKPPARSGSPQATKRDTNLPPAVQARIDRITQKEILGQVVRPLPMALLGIAGHDAFVRAPNGQTGLLREGEELGGLKLLRIGVNRVLVEHEQQRKELTLFSGFGGESLMPATATDSRPVIPVTPAAPVTPVTPGAKP